MHWGPIGLHKAPWHPTGLPMGSLCIPMDFQCTPEDSYGVPLDVLSISYGFPIVTSQDFLWMSYGSLGIP